MYGDADGFKTNKLYIPRTKVNDAELPRFLEFLQKCLEAYPYGRGGKDVYDHIEDYDRYVEGDSNPEDIDDNFIMLWEYEPGYGFRASLDNYKVTYFDKGGIEYFVEIT